MHGVVLRSLAAALLFIMLFGAQAAELQQGDAAPGFELLDQNGKWHGLPDYAGQWLVLYFYPRDDTPGCTTEACEFRDDIVVLKGMGVAVLGVSTDDVQSHRQFAEKYHLSFPLLSDSSGEVARRYGALRNLGFMKFARRHTFIIGPDGSIAKIYRKVDPKTHSDRVIEDIKQLLS